MGYHLQSFETLLRTLSEYLNLKDEQCLSLPREAYLSPELHALELDRSGAGTRKRTSQRVWHERKNRLSRTGHRPKLIASPSRLQSNVITE